MLDRNQWVKSLLLRIPHAALLSAYYGSYGVRQFVTESQLYKETGLAWFGPEHFTRRSDTVFILGSGSSINRIPEERWRAIREHDSFAFNFFLRHDHTPSLYAMEALDTRVQGVATSQWLRIARLRASGYQSVPKLFTDLKPGSLGMFKNLPEEWRRSSFAAHTVSAFARTPGELARAVRWLERARLFDGDGAWSLAFKYRATLSMLLGLAVRMGFRRIVLCGIDLRDPAYFYQDADKYPDMVDFWSSPVKTQHTTLIKKPLLMAIDQVVYLMNELLLRPRGVELFVEHGGSALYPTIPEAPQALYAAP